MNWWKENKHTPRPWEIERRGTNQYGLVGGPNRIWITWLSNYTDECGPPKSADMQLIRTAPDLLEEARENMEALSDVINRLVGIADNELLDKLKARLAATRAVISKAKAPRCISDTEEELRK